MEQPPAYSPQAIADILPIYRPRYADEHIRVYKVRQKAADTMALTLLDDTDIYSIRTRATGGFMNRKPHVTISKSEDTLVIAEGKFDNVGTGTTISYLNPPRTQFLDLENSQMQLLKTTIDDIDHWWQPHPGNRGVLELTNETEEIVARFTFAAPVPQLSRAGTVGSVKDSCKHRDVGELSVVEALAVGETGREEILCSAVVVIDRAKRRAANMSKNGAAFKGSAAWGMTTPAGGFM